MAKIPTTKKVGNDVMGLTKQATTTKGPFGGGTKYNQMKTPAGFALNTVKGHNQKKPNLTPIIDNK